MAKKRKRRKFRPRIYDHVLKILQNRRKPMTLDKIADDTGLSKSWLSKVASGNCPDPSVNKMELLYFYLTGNVIELDD